LLLHDVEGFQDDNLCTALQHWAPLGLGDGLVKRVSFDNRVAINAEPSLTVPLLAMVLA
jgi:hypothetical protein